MSAIETLTGPIDADDLGIVACHEYLLMGLPGWHHDPDVNFDRPQAFDDICAALEKFKSAGGGAVVDVSGITLGRNVPFYRRISEHSGVPIVAATGLPSQSMGIPAHFRTTALFYRGEGPLSWKRDIPGHFAPSSIGSKEYLMFLFFNELTEGMVAPGMIRTPIRAGVVKADWGWDEITHVEVLSIQGAATAARKSGAALIVDGANQLDALIPLVEGEGLAAERVVVAGRDDRRATDNKRDIALAETGAAVAYDHIGWDEASAPHGMSDDDRVALVKAMVDAGFADRVVLSGSAIGCALGLAPSPHSYAHLLEDFVPRLQKAGVGEDAIETMLKANPRRLLSGGTAERA